MTRNRSRIAILASGTGSNAHALADAVDAGTIDADLALVVSDRPAAPVLASMRARGVPVQLVEPRQFADRSAFERHLVGVLDAAAVDWVVLAGYMRICGPQFLARFTGRTVNVHPSLLPEFPGLDAIGQALAAGVSATGVSVHFIDDGIDTGPLIAQVTVPILPNDSRDSLAARIQAAEHELYPRVVADVVAGRITAAAPAPHSRMEVHS